MNKVVHSIYTGTMTLIVVVVTVYLGYTGYSYYQLSIEERFYHPHYDWFKPSGILGQGLGIIGTLLILFGVGIYIARKRYGFLERFIRLKYLLEFHIFLCVLGPILILYHTTFKFGGIVAIAFWSMTAVVLSGIVGRFIYIQIPRTINGRELSIAEVKNSRAELVEKLKSHKGLSQSTIDMILEDEHEHSWGLNSFLKRTKKMAAIKRELKKNNIDKKDRAHIINIIKQEMTLAGKISRLQLMQKLFKYWHVVHMPFAIIMLVIVIVHIAITVALGYRWIF